MSTWDRRFIRLPQSVGEHDGPYSTHFPRDVALNLNVAHAYLVRPTLVSDVYQGAFQQEPAWYSAYLDTDPGEMVITYPAGRGPVPADYTHLAGHLTGQCAAGSAPSAAATTASFRVWSDDRPYRGNFGPRAQSFLIEIAKADGRRRVAFDGLPLIRDSNGFTYVTVTAWTDGAVTAGGKPPVEDRALIEALHVHAYFPAGLTILDV